MLMAAMQPSEEKIDRGLRLREVCPTCRKKVQRKGSLTGWIFQHQNCSCANRQAEFSNCRQVVQTEPTTAIDAVDSEIEQLNSQYEISGLIGRGGMGSVFKAKDKSSGNHVAIKVLHQRFADDTSALRRFELEIEAAGMLSHSNLVSVLGAGRLASGAPYLVMDYAAGTTLSSLLEMQGSLREESVFEIFEQVGEGLRYLHDQGIIHRDLKPANIIVSDTDSGAVSVKIVDYGIAKLQSSSAREAVNITQTGDVFGSPEYMSPEQCLGLEQDHRSDLYSLGCVMFECLAGHPPFRGDNPVQVISRHLSDESPDFRGKRIRQGPEQLIRGCLAKSPEARYQTVEALLTDLERVRSGKDARLDPYGWTPALIQRRVLAALIDALILFLTYVSVLQSALFIVSFCIGSPMDAGSVLQYWLELSEGVMFWAFLYLTVLLDAVFALPAVIGSGTAMIGIGALKLPIPISQPTAGQLLTAALNQPLIRLCLITLCMVLINWLYHAIWESSRFQATPGKLIMRLKVVRVDGKRLTFLDATKRHFCRPFLMLVLPDLGRIVVDFKRERLEAVRRVLRQPAHDKLSDCLVVLKRSASDNSRGKKPMLGLSKD